MCVSTEVGTDTLRQNYSFFCTVLERDFLLFFLCFMLLWRIDRDDFTSKLTDLQMLVWAGEGYQSTVTDVYFNIAVCMYTSCVTTLLSAWKGSPQILHPSNGIELRASTTRRVQRVQRQRPHWPPQLKR